MRFIRVQKENKEDSGIFINLDLVKLIEFDTDDLTIEIEFVDDNNENYKMDKDDFTTLQAIL